MSSIIYAALLLGAVNANNIAPDSNVDPVAPQVTPRAILPRENYKTLAWYSTNNNYAPWEYDADATTYSTSGAYFRRCPTDTKCDMFTACSNGYLVAPGTSSFCGNGGSDTYTCGSHVLYPSLSASEKREWFWCDEQPFSGYTLFEQTTKGAVTSATPTTASPSQSPSASSSSSPSDQSSESANPSETASAAANTGSSSPSHPQETNHFANASPSSTPVTSPTPLPASHGTKKATVAGAVVGSLALVAIAIGALFFVRRRRSRAAGEELPQTEPQVARPPSYASTPETLPAGGVVGGKKERRVVEEVRAVGDEMTPPVTPRAHGFA
ncbi:hypothetical protein BU24DRAFT_489174 [Aaosphaeria arxii CBS 175.79]|uniref:Uncharacterized protein n=1 Tax=Aaosphaeria arxii CBS 175.79 TaxID=1450172 RepID=A0A6A5Y0T9_9PLEO|nr:uncharacterized protein BU24DRAFT_489174 [Aaosphaeria arxii CBS 175.79]KAF2019148.1 hypothetical protein BU24DRAFT_489174 [Aaosphaeria arxii CBS 175.79]